MTQRMERVRERMQAAMRQAGADRLSMDQVARILTDELLAEGLDLRYEPPLDAVKLLLAEALHAERTIAEWRRADVTRWVTACVLAEAAQAVMCR